MPGDTAILEALVHSAASGDIAAQQQLLSRYWPLLRAVVQRNLRRAGPARRQGEATEDALQEAALRILRQLPRQEWRGRSAFIGWLCALSRSHVQDLLRERNAQKRGAALREPLDEANAWVQVPGVETWLEGRLQAERLRPLLQRLTEEQRTALFLHHSGYSHSEVGEVLGCSEEAARKQVARATARLALLLGKSA